MEDSKQAADRSLQAAGMFEGKQRSLPEALGEQPHNQGEPLHKQDRNYRGKARY